MSAPIINHEDAIQGALSELVSAMSALNMEPDPLPIPADDRPYHYLSEVDGWAKHAMEHMHAVFELLTLAARDRENLRAQIFRLQIKVLEGKHGGLR